VVVVVVVVVEVGSGTGFVPTKTLPTAGPISPEPDAAGDATMLAVVRMSERSHAGPERRGDTPSTPRPGEADPGAPEPLARANKPLPEEARSPPARTSMTTPARTRRLALLDG
jgi:hypothetical protein